MQRQNRSKRGIYQAVATGVSANITHPFCDAVPVQAASAVPDSGGFGHSRVEAFRYKEILSFRAAYTEVAGIEPEEGIYETLSLSVVEGLNVLDVVTCDRIVGRVTGKLHDKGPEDRGEPSIVPIGSRFEGLRIGNTYFGDLELAPDFFCNPDFTNWTGLLNAARGERLSHLQGLSLPAPDGAPADLAEGERRGILGFCVAPNEFRGGREILRSPAIIDVPGFGAVHLGEFFCYPYSRCLTMLRVQLGCAIGGGATAGYVCGGPRTYP